MQVGTLLAQKGPDAYKVVTISANKTLLELADLLSHNEIGAVPVLDDGGTMVGIVSERDIVDTCAVHGTSGLTMKVGQIMTRGVTAVSLHTTVDEAMDMMTTHHVRHLPVIVDGVVAAMISIKDVVYQQVLARHAERYWRGPRN